MDLASRALDSVLKNRYFNYAANCITTGRIRTAYLIGSQQRGVPLLLEPEGRIKGFNCAIPALWHLRHTLGIETITLKKRAKFDAIGEELRFLFSSTNLTTDGESQLKTMTLQRSHLINRGQLNGALRMSWGMRVAIKTTLAVYALQYATDIAIVLGGAGFFYLYGKSTKGFKDGKSFHSTSIGNQLAKICDYIIIKLGNIVEENDNGPKAS